LSVISANVLRKLHSTAVDRIERLRKARRQPPLDLGEDCAIAGDATAATAAPVADTFKKSRRFIQASPCWGVSQISWSIVRRIDFSRLRKGALAGALLTRKFGGENATKA